jgi:hypothetical protein
MRKANQTCRNPKVELADGEYMLLKAELRNCGNPNAITIRIMERRFGLRRGQLANYRANFYSRQKR